MKLVKDIENKKNEIQKVSDKEAEEAFVKILEWMGEDPGREGLLETPKRVVKAFKEYFKGYTQDPRKELEKTFGDVDGYDDMVIQKNISVQSHCEHHMAPIIGVAHVAYIPNKRVVGLSKTGLNGDIQILNSGQFRARGGGAAYNEFALDPDPMNLNQWYHLICTLSESRYVKAYTNGVLKATYDHGVGIASFYSGGKSVQIGRYIDGGNSFQYTGKIGQINKYYNK